MNQHDHCFSKREPKQGNVEDYVSTLSWLTIWRQSKQYTEKAQNLFLQNTLFLYSPHCFSICYHFITFKRSLLPFYWFHLPINEQVVCCLKSQNSLYCSSNKEKKSLLWKVHWKTGRRFCSIAPTFSWEKSEKFWQYFGQFQGERIVQRQFPFLLQISFHFTTTHRPHSPRPSCPTSLM